MLASTVLFIVSFCGIAFLFTVKYFEIKRSRVTFPALRETLDKTALWCARSLERAEGELAYIPPKVLQVARGLLAAGAASFGSIAETIARESHRLADFVSHKHNFERRETRSEFLRQVTEHKNGNGGGGVRKD